MRNAKIVCTLGPAAGDRGTIRALADAGMSVARLNVSHGTTDQRARYVDHVRAVDDAIDRPLAVMVDLRGPETRTGTVDGSLELAEGGRVRFVEGDDANEDRIGLSRSIAAVSPGDEVLLDDGRIETTVDSVEGGTVVATVTAGGTLDDRRSVTVVGTDIDQELVGEADRRELAFAAEQSVDFVAASFVSDAADVYEVADVLDDHGGNDIPVVAKVERAAAVENLDEIVAAADGVMVARGDLGVECPLEDVPIIQKRVINRCMVAGIPVITATEMLDSMVHGQRPTRAEASDVANAVLDGTDAVMLSAETAVGVDPVRAVETMDRIVRRIETSPEYAETRDQRVPPADPAIRTDALARSARYLARDVDATSIVAVSESGYTARKTAKFRPGVPVIAATPNDRVRRQLSLSWGVDARYATYASDVDDVLESAVDVALEAGVAESGDAIVVLSGMMTELPGTDATNTLKVHVVAETVATGRAVVAGRVAAPVARTADGDLSSVPDGSILVLPDDFDGEFDGDVGRIAGIVAAQSGMTGYPAIVARELAVPMLSGAIIPESVADGTVVTLDGERGVVYEGDVTASASDRPGNDRSTADRGTTDR